MHWKNAFIVTLRKDPAEAALISHKLMLRAGLIRKSSLGTFSYLPAGLRVLRKIENLLRRGMDTWGAIELMLPALNSTEWLKETGRVSCFGSELFLCTDKKNNELYLSSSGIDAIIDVARATLRSYRDLPICFYQVTSLFRDEKKPRSGLLRSSEFLVAEAYSFHADRASLEAMHCTVTETYNRILTQCGVRYKTIREKSNDDDTCYLSIEYFAIMDTGDRTIVCCDKCTYTASKENAVSRSVEDNCNETNFTSAPKPVEIVTPGMKSIEEVSAFLKIEKSSTIKMLVYDIDNGKGLVAVCISGDRDINESKLKKATHAETISILSDEEWPIRVSIPKGYCGAYALEKSSFTEIIADYSVKNMQDAVCGANKENYHMVHIYPLRDFVIDRYVDIGFTAAGNSCAFCNDGKIEHLQGIKVAEVNGIERADLKNVSFLDCNGLPRPFYCGHYSFGISRLAAVAAEQHNDKDGILWPVRIAPYTVALLCLDAKDEKVKETVALLYLGLDKHGIDVIIDERDDRAGVKFKDADLLGFPVRVVISVRGVEAGSVEIKRRENAEIIKIPIQEAVSFILTTICNLEKQETNQKI